jgi:poly-beta-1,6-N-acetyl-D-glucosamine synthase
MVDLLILPDAEDTREQLTAHTSRNVVNLSMNKQYVLLTAAKDEEAFIEDVVASVLRQTVLPAAWVIIDDGSSDRTGPIVERMASEHPFIHLQSTTSRGGRNFGSKDKAIMAAYRLAESLEFGFVGVLDADTTLERKDYYESILEEFDRNPQLGLAGGFVYERRRVAWEIRPDNSEDSVPGTGAIFRRSCFDQIGGYTPLRYGGSDWLVQLDAKMAGWDTMTLPDLHIFHYRPTSSAGGIWRGMFRRGLMDASFGSDPVFEFFKCGRRALTRPLGSLVHFGGYLWWNLVGRKPLIDDEKVAFLRREQRAKLQKWAAQFGTGRKWSRSPLSP